MTFQSCTCSNPQLVRSRQRGILDRLLAVFGAYPWACKRCAWRQYRWKRRPDA